MNWDALGKLVGWLPGAAAGSVAGLLLALFSFDSFAIRCPMGRPFIGIGGAVVQLSQDCVESPLGDLGMAAYIGALTFLGAVSGILFEAARQALKGLQPKS